MTDRTPMPSEEETVFWSEAQILLDSLTLATITNDEDKKKFCVDTFEAWSLKQNIAPTLVSFLLASYVVIFERYALSMSFSIEQIKDMFFDQAMLLSQLIVDPSTLTEIFPDVEKEK